MGEKELTPAIRFKGFTDPWEQRKLEQISTRVTSIGHDLSLPRIEYEDIVARRGELKKEIAKNISLKIGILFAPGDVLYGKLRPYLMHWLHPQFSGVAVGDFWVFRPTSTDSSFFYCLIQSEQFQQAAAVSIGSKMPRADWKYVSEFPYLVPKQIHEQQNIGLLFEGLELYIALHQRKLEKLQRMKQALLEKLFPKNGAVVPELRFNGFTDAWEQRKLGNIASLYQPHTISSDDLLPAGIPVFGANGYIGFYSEANHWVDQVTISARGEEAGTPNYVVSPAWITGNSMVVNTDSVEIDKKFLYFNLCATPLKKFVTGGAQPQLTRSVLGKAEIAVTVIVEERAISSILGCLSSLIALHQRKLEKLQQLKSAFLTKMFV